MLRARHVQREADPRRASWAVRLELQLHSAPPPPSTMALLKSIILPPAGAGPATASVIFAHGLGDSGAGWLDGACAVPVQREHR